MQTRRSDQIIGLQAPHGGWVGFHSSNLDVAEISEELWQSFENPGLDPEAQNQLQAWNNEISSEVRPEPIRKNVHSLSINVTQLCNLHCVYCAAGGDGTYGSPQTKIAVEKTLPQIEILMDRLSESEAFHITFLGGEPLLYAEGMKVLAEYAIEKAKSKNIRLKFNTITNGTLFTEATIEILKSFRSHLTISLDGPAEINDQVRPGKGQKSVTEKVIAGVRLLQAHRSELGSIGVQGVFGPHNSKPLRSYLFYRELNLDWYDFHFDHESQDPAASSEFAEEMAKVAQTAYETLGEKGLRQIKFFDQLFTQLDTKTRNENFCGSGQSYVVVDAKNRVYLCPWAVNDPALAVGAGTQITSESTQPRKNSLLSTNNCGDCWARYLCGGGCMWAHKKATGDRHKVDLVFCDRTRSLISMGILYYYQLRKASL